MSDIGYLIRDISTPVLQKLTGSCLPLLISTTTSFSHVLFPVWLYNKHTSSFHQIPEQFGTLRSVFHFANEFYVVLTKSTLFAHLILAVCHIIPGQSKHVLRFKISHKMT